MIYEEFENLIKDKGIYSSINGVTHEIYENIFSDSKGLNSMDLFCSKCKTNKTFVYSCDGESDLMGKYKGNSGRNFYTVGNLQYTTYECPKCETKIIYIFLLEGEKLIKIGQYPSLYEIRRDELKKYAKNKMIDDIYFKEINKADVCAGEGYYVASFTYMRRVFENLIKNIFNENSAEIGFSYEEYEKLRMDEKIKAIKPYLPVDDDIYKPLFQILSAGVHALPEDECSEYYQILRAVLLEVLEEFKRKKEKEANRKSLKILFSKKENKDDKNEG